MNAYFGCILVGALSFYTQNAHAIYFSSYIYEIPSNEDFISKAVKNDTKTMNMYQISSFKIDRPGNKGENVLYDKNRELIYAPVQLQIEANATDFFKIMYIGPKDNIERYYRINFLETSLIPVIVDRTQSNLTTFFPSVSVSTILVVRPRQQNLKYIVDEKSGVIQNTGNTFFRVVIQNGCDGNDQEAEQFYMLPGERYQDDRVKTLNRKFIVANKRYIPVGKLCHSKN